MRCCATNNPGVHHLNFNTVADRREQRERSRRISDSFAPAKPVPVLWIGLPGGFYLFTELLTQDTRRRVIALLDVNVLVALFDPAHVHHEAAHTGSDAIAVADGRLVRSRKTRWSASCPLRPTLAGAPRSRMQPHVCVPSVRIVSMFSGRTRSA